MNRSEAASQKPYLIECLCGAVFESRYERRVTECRKCRRRRNRLEFRRRKADPEYGARRSALAPEAKLWQHCHYIATDLFGPDANLRSSLGLAFRERS